MFSGSLVALVTPMKADGEIDWRSLAELIEWHIESGTDAIVSVGTTGESSTLSVKEHVNVIAKTIQYAQGRIPVIAGTGANATKEAIEWTQEAQLLGADAALLVTPYYNKPSQEGLYQHYSAIAKAASIPQILYNVPGRTACDLLPDTVARLAKIDNIIGIKEATGDIERGKAILAKVNDRFLLLSGDDASFLDLMAIGARGNVSVTANIAPQAMAEICRLANDKMFMQASEKNQRIASLHEVLFIESNPVPVKWALQAMQKIPKGIRLPLTTLSEQHQQTLIDALKLSGIK